MFNNEVKFIPYHPKSTFKYRLEQAKYKKVNFISSVNKKEWRYDK